MEKHLHFLRKVHAGTLRKQYLLPNDGALYHALTTIHVDRLPGDEAG